MKRNLKTVPQFVAEGPFTQGQIRYWIFRADDNGLADAGAVVRIQHRVYVDVDAFEAWIDRQQPARACA